MLKSPRTALAACVSLVAVALGLPMLLGRGPVRADRFDESLIDDLNREKPEILLIGDSMLYTRLHLDGLRKLAADRRLSEYSVGGSASATWYLYFKNVAMAAKRPPQMVVFFFRDDVWSQPHLRTAGARRDHLLELSPDLTTDLGVVPGFADDSLTLAGLPRRLYPVVDFRNYLRQRLVLLIQDAVSGTGSKHPLVKERRERFDLGNLRSDLPAELPEANEHTEGDLQFDPDGTFLPEILSLAEDKGVRVVLYRVKRRPDAAGQREESPELAAYVASLRSWLETRGGVLVDESGDSSLGLNLYLDGDHLRESARPAWTVAFWRRLEPVVKGGPPR